MAKPKKAKGRAKGPELKLHKRRDPLACVPIMAKGGVHETTHKAKRKKDKMAMKKALSKRDFDGAFSIMRSLISKFINVLSFRISSSKNSSYIQLA